MKSSAAVYTFCFKQLLYGLLFLVAIKAEGQIEVANGPDLYADRDMNFNRIIGGDKDHFFVYRVRSKGFGTDYYLEKYSKTELKREFIKELPLPENVTADILDIKFAQQNICLFYKIYNKKTDQKSLVLQNISTNGDLDPNLKEIITVTAEKSQYAGFNVVSNEDSTRLLVVTEYKHDKKDSYKINMLLMDALNIKKLWEKELPSKYNSAPMDVVSYKIDKQDNVYFLFRTPGKQIGQRGMLYRTYIGVLKPDATEIQVSELPIANDYSVNDVEFIKNGNQLVCGGFYKDIVERQGRDLVDVGVFYYTFDFNSGNLLSSSNQLFSDALLNKLSYKRQQAGYFDYKIDYIKTIGNDVYLIGEQYSEEYVYYYNPSTRTTSAYWLYDYKDILVAKLSNQSTTVDWIRNIPFRYAMRMNSPHIFMHYFAYNTENNLYLFYDENRKNFSDYTFDNYEPKKIKYYSSIHGTNFVAASINVNSGKMDRQVVFRNDDYCFAPIQENNLQFVPANNTQIFVDDGKDRIIIYTEDRGNERFSRLKLK
ncbi:MAG: hypothetical protein ACXVPQ_03395 [Bacteroidia bacterium]